jgi:predicted transcriptional regulator
MLFSTISFAIAFFFFFLDKGGNKRKQRGMLKMTSVHVSESLTKCERMEMHHAYKMSRDISFLNRERNKGP